MQQIREFQLAELNVDQDNFRLGSFSDQRSCIQAMVRRQGEKLLELAQDILDVGLSPGEPLWVAPDPRSQGKFVVLEGNRRITALKVMDNPALASGTDFETAYRRLNARFVETPRRVVRAALFDSVEEAAPWVERRHTNEQSGVGIQWWDPFAQDRAAKAKGRSRNRSMVLMEHLSEEGDPEPLANRLGLDDRTTTVDRVLNTFAEEFSFIGITISRRQPWSVDFGSDPHTNRELMWAILGALKDKSVDHVKSLKQRIEFIRGVIAGLAEAQQAPPTSPPKPTDQNPNGSAGGNGGDFSGNASGTWRPGGREDSDSKGGRGSGPSGASPETSGATGSTATDRGGGRRPKKPENDRSTLASTLIESTLHVSGKRLKQVYAEARKIDVDDQRNAASMMIRLFLELSVEAYCKAFVGLPHKHRDKADWSARGIRLEDKIKAVLDHLDPTSTDITLNHAREGLSNDPAYAHNLNKVHAFMHDPERVLNPKELITIWDRWFPLMRAVHDSLSAQK